MTQLIIAGLVLVALLGSIWKVYDAGGDAREEAVRAEYAVAAEKDRAVREAHEKQLRDWALQLSKGYLAFGEQQGKHFTGVADEIAQQIARSPALRRACFDAGVVRDFNGTAAAAEGGARNASGARDGGVRSRDPSAASK